MKNLAIILLCLFFAAGPPSVYSQEQESREFFSKAYALFAEGNLAQAKDLFQKTLDGNFLLEDHSLYFSGAIALARGELESARAHFAKLKQQFPLSIWAAHAELHRAKISLAENKNEQAMGELRALTNRSL